MAPTPSHLTLNTGAPIPAIGFGVFLVPPKETVEPVRAALEAGYRLVDTAAAYRNESGVGQAIRDSGIPREEIFLTTKLWNSDHVSGRVAEALDASLAALGTDYVDLYLIHWPVPKRDRYVAAWEAMIKLAADGRARAIGVSNFTVPHLERIIAETGVTPAVNQVELHPGFPQEALRAFHTAHGIITEAWAPIGGQGRGLLDHPVIGRLAAETGRTPAQVVLRWHLQLGNDVPLPKSVQPERIRSNREVFDWALADDQMEALNGIEGGRGGPDPETFETP